MLIMNEYLLVSNALPPDRTLLRNRTYGVLEHTPVVSGTVSGELYVDDVLVNTINDLGGGYLSIGIEGGKYWWLREAWVEYTTGEVDLFWSEEPPENFYVSFTYRVDSEGNCVISPRLEPVNWMKEGF